MVKGWQQLIKFEVVIDSDQTTTILDEEIRSLNQRESADTDVIESADAMTAFS